MGCGTACVRTRSYRAALGALPCTDAAPGSAALGLYADEWARVAEGWPTDWAVSSRLIWAPSLKHLGCASHGPWSHPCAPSCI